jgi:hypothetical protein
LEGFSVLTGFISEIPPGLPFSKGGELLLEGCGEKFFLWMDRARGIWSKTFRARRIR